MVTWGMAACGGDSRRVQPRLVDVQCLEQQFFGPGPGRGVAVFFFFFFFSSFFPLRVFCLLAP